MTDEEQRMHALNILHQFDDVVVKTIREATETSVLKGVPCGTLYTALMSTKLCASWSAEDFERYISGLVRSGKVKHTNGHLLSVI